jgi:signal transduction histidine kinase
MSSRFSRLAAVTAAVGVLLVAIFAVTVIYLSVELRGAIHQKIIERDAAVLMPVALQQLSEKEAASVERPAGPEDLLGAVLKSAQQDGMLAVAVFNADGSTLRAVPASLLFVELPVDDYQRLLRLEPISRYHAAFPLDRYFSGVSAAHRTAPVLEILLPLHGRDPSSIVGFAQYYVDARPLAGELTTIDGRINRQIATTLSIGSALIALTLTVGYFGLARAQRQIAERNARLTRANFELSLAAKTSAIGQITSHLIHGLQGPVAGLRAVMAEHGHEAGIAAWESAATYTERMRAMIDETIALLGDANAHAVYELSGRELAETIRKRNAPAAAEKGVLLEVNEGFDSPLDSHRGSLLCLIATNLIQNGIGATSRGDRVSVSLTRTPEVVTLVVEDEGDGIPEAIRPHLFEPGRSGRAGSGLGLAISQLLARQIGATLSLEQTGPEGTTFRLTLPAATT